MVFARPYADACMQQYKNRFKMSWLTRILPKIATKPADAETKKKSPIPAGLWTKCPWQERAAYF